MADFVAPIGVGGVPLAFPDLNWAAATTVAISTSSVQSAAINARVVALSNDQNCWVSMGANPTAAFGPNSMLLVASAGVKFLAMQPGWKIAVIDVSGGPAGTLSIVPCVYPG